MFGGPRFAGTMFGGLITSSVGAAVPPGLPGLVGPALPVPPTS